MAQDYLTMTPGSAVASTIQDILETKRKESRQAMLDELQRQNVTSEMKTREDQAATNKEYREGLISDRKGKEADRNKTQQRFQALSDYASQQYPNDPTENQMWRVMEQDPERGEQLFATLMSKKLGETDKHPWEPVFHTDRSGNTWDTGVTAPTGAHFTNEPAPQQPNASTLPSLYQIERPNPADPAKPLTVPMWLTPGQQIEQGKPLSRPPVGPTQPGQAPVVPQVRKGNEPAPTAPKPTTAYNAQAYGMYQAALRSGSPNAAPARLSARQAFVNTITDPAVKQDIIQILQHPQLKKMTSDQLIQSGALTNTESDPQHREKVKAILDLIPMNNRD